MEKMSHREYLTRLAWIRENYEDPTRSDFYLMQIAQEVRRVLNKKPKSVKLKHLLLSFIGRKEPTKKEKMQSSKHAWFGALGLPSTENDDQPEGLE